MALSTEMSSILERLMNALLNRKESFRAIFMKMTPVIHYEGEFLAAFFMGYVASSYKQLFLILNNRDMVYDEVSEVLDFLTRNESKIREVLLGNQAPKQEIQGALEKVIELSVNQMRQEMNLIKEAVDKEVIEYGVKVTKSGEGMSDRSRVMQKRFIPQNEYEQMLRFLAWLDNFYYKKSGYEPMTFLSDTLLERIAWKLASTDKNSDVK